jgi:FAD binding domain/Berberine and berberine like
MLNTMNAIVKPSRRNLLKFGAAASAIGTSSWLASCGGAKPAPTTAVSEALRALAPDMEGRMLFPEDDAYSAIVRPNNAVFSTVAPMAIGLCKSPADVQRCLKFVGEYQQPFAVRSGGHSYAGYSTTPGLLIHVGFMKGAAVDLNQGTVTIQAGMNNQDLATALRTYPFAVPTGRCPGVGASGLVLGGGWGFATTKAGLTCDSLLATDVVLADGRLVTANAASEADLFWAARGAGGGNFGVHTAFTFKLLPVNTVTTVNLKFKAGKVVDIMLLLQDLQLQNPRTLNLRFKMLPERNGNTYTVDDFHAEALGTYWGTPAGLREILAPLVAKHMPAVSDIREQAYWDARDYLVTDDPEGLYDLRSSYSEKVTGDGFDLMTQWMARWPGGANLQENMAILFAAGGAVADVDPNATAYNHRRSNFIVQQEVSWSPLDSPSLRQKQSEWLSQYYAEAQRFLQPRSYVNFPDRTMKDWATRYYGDNLTRLTQVKQKYDPTNVFRFAQSIPLST